MTQPPSQSERDPGLSGFVVSLVGLLTFGILSPIGLGMSIVALVRDKYSALAKVGVVLGALGLVEAIAVLFVFRDTIADLIHFLRYGMV